MLDPDWSIWLMYLNVLDPDVLTYTCENTND